MKRCLIDRELDTCCRAAPEKLRADWRQHLEICERCRERMRTFAQNLVLEEELKAALKVSFAPIRSIASDG